MSLRHLRHFALSSPFFNPRSRFCSRASRSFSRDLRLFDTFVRSSSHPDVVRPRIVRRVRADARSREPRARGALPSRPRSRARARLLRLEERERASLPPRGPRRPWPRGFDRPALAPWLCVCQVPRGREEGRRPFRDSGHQARLPWVRRLDDGSERVRSALGPARRLGRVHGLRAVQARDPRILSTGSNPASARRGRRTPPGASAPRGRRQPGDAHDFDPRRKGSEGRPVVLHR